MRQCYNPSPCYNMRASVLPSRMCGCGESLCGLCQPPLQPLCLPPLHKGQNSDLLMLGIGIIIGKLCSQ